MLVLSKGGETTKSRKTGTEAQNTGKETNFVGFTVISKPPKIGNYASRLGYMCDERDAFTLCIDQPDNALHIPPPHLVS